MGQIPAGHHIFGRTVNELAHHERNIGAGKQPAVAATIRDVATNLPEHQDRFGAPGAARPGHLLRSRPATPSHSGVLARRPVCQQAGGRGCTAASVATLSALRRAGRARCGDREGRRGLTLTRVRLPDLARERES